MVAGHIAMSRNVTLYRGEIERADAVIVHGERSGRAIRKSYEAANVPVFTVDFGYMRRVNGLDEASTGHFQVGRGGLNMIPEFVCPPDRFDALGLDVVAQGGDPNGYVLVCGQVPGDAALGQDGVEHEKWLRSQLSQYDNAIYRPHPRGGIDLAGIESNRQSLADALSGARLVVTYSSNVGHDALLAGVPVMAHGPAAYTELCGDLPSVKARREYFSRVAYGQWTLAEIRRGDCMRFIEKHLLTGASPAGVTQPPQRDVEETTEAIESVAKKATKRAAKRASKKAITPA